jgi:hypothetical protein
VVRIALSVANALVSAARAAYQEYFLDYIYPEVTDDDGTRVRIVAGNFLGKTGPVDGVAAEPVYLDVSVAPGRRKLYRWKRLVPKQRHQRVRPGASSVRAGFNAVISREAKMRKVDWFATVLLAIAISTLAAWIYTAIRSVML